MTRNFRTALAAMAIGLAVMGCQGQMADVMSLRNTGEAEPPAQLSAAPATGTYYLVGPDGKELYRRDLRKGDELGFRVRGNRVEAVAGGAVALIDYQEFTRGGTYKWQVEEQKKE